MCEGCYAEFGFPKVVNGDTLHAAGLMAKVYEFSCVGGNLHCELDDWNIDDVFFKDEFKPYDVGVSAEQLAAERECFDALKAMSLDDRASALALYDKFLLPDGSLAAWINEGAYRAETEEYEPLADT